MRDYNLKRKATNPKGDATNFERRGYTPKRRG
jgi:hypothetical protein